MTARNDLLVRTAPLAAAAVLALGCATSGAVPARPTPTYSTVAGLRSAIDSMTSAPGFRNAHWGVLIVDPRSGDTVYSLNAGKLFMPASNMKIVTGAAALMVLGPEFQFRSTFATRGQLRDSVLYGDLVVHGRGDPSISDRMRGDAMLPLGAVADSLGALGIRHIAGRVVAGDDAFPDAGHGFGWAWDDFAQPYAAAVDELYFNEGYARVTLRGGALAGAPVTATIGPALGYPRLRIEATTVARDTAIAWGGGGLNLTASDAEVVYDPRSGLMVVTGQLLPRDSLMLRVVYPDQRAAYLSALQDALLSRGITVSGTPRREVAPLETLFVYQSPPLREILPALQKPSQNQVAEILFKTLGLERTGVGTADSGRRVVDSLLLAWGAEPDGFVIRDGSGLSRFNYLSPETLVRTLDAVARDTAFTAFYDALPVAGVDGTIASRMRGTPAEGNARAKTGFISNVRSLSGYVTTADGRMLIFSLMCNNWTSPVWDVERVQDAIVAHLANLRMDRGGA